MIAWDNNGNSTLSGNCIGTNVCNGANSGVNNDAGANTVRDEQIALDDVDDEKTVEIVDRDKFDSEEVSKDKSTKAPETENQENKENTNKEQADNNSDPKPSVTISNLQSQQNPNQFPYNQYPQYPNNFAYPPFTVIGAAVTSNIPFLPPNYFNYPQIRKQSSTGSFDSKMETSTRRTSMHNTHKKNKKPQIIMQLNEPINSKKPMEENVVQMASPLNLNNNNFPAYLNGPNQFGSNHFGPNQFPGNQFPSNQFPSNQFAMNQFPGNSFVQNQFGNPNGGFPQFPNGPYNQFNQFHNPFNTPNFNGQSSQNNGPSNQGDSQDSNVQQINPSIQNSHFNNFNSFPPYFGPPQSGVIINGVPVTNANQHQFDNGDNMSKKPNNEPNRIEYTNGAESTENNHNCIGENVCNRVPRSKVI